MKTNTFFYTLLIALISLTLFSCDNSDDLDLQEKSYALSDNDDIEIPIPIIPNAQVDNDDIEIPIPIMPKAVTDNDIIEPPIPIIPDSI